MRWCILKQILLFIIPDHHNISYLLRESRHQVRLSVHIRYIWDRESGLNPTIPESNNSFPTDMHWQNSPTLRSTQIVWLCNRGQYTTLRNGKHTPYCLFTVTHRVRSPAAKSYIISERTEGCLPLSCIVLWPPLHSHAICMERKVGDFVVTTWPIGGFETDGETDGRCSLNGTKMIFRPM